MVEMGLGVLGTVTTMLLLGGFSERRVLAASLVAILCGGLVVVWRNRRRRSSTFLEGGALRGSGYAADFRGAKRSLLLMHIDDDAPSDALHELYRDKLEGGVQIRRVVLLRPDHHEDGYRWLSTVGEHPQLQQRLVRAGRGSVMPLSFVVVDEAVVLLAVPGFGPGESGPLASRMVLRHLVRLTQPEVVRAFVEAYEAAWTSASTPSHLDAA